MSPHGATDAQLFELAFRHAAVGMALVSLEGQYLQVNDALCRIVGYDRDELLTLDFQSITHADDLDLDLDHVRRLIAGDIDRYDLEKRYVRKDGHTVWGLLTVSLVRSPDDDQPRFFVSQVQDISRRKAAESELDAYFRLSPDMLAIAGDDERFERVNPAWQQALGWTDQELTSTPYLELVHPDDRHDTIGELSSVYRGQPAAAFRSRFRARDGSYRYLAWNASLSPEGRMYCSARDVTVQHETEAALRQQEQAQAAELERLATLDSLTGIANRRHFCELAERELRRRDRQDTALAVLVIDADHFKAINDLHGHAAGDQVLRALGDILQAELRDTDLLCRWGGEEFVVLLVGTDTIGAQIAAERIVQRCADAEIAYDGDALRVTVSVGASACYPEERDIEVIVARADRAMYAAKAAGRNRAHVA
jgi:diguanylate cyclase (GGDEF)-like protein/PAS domain S-box-containing protein